MKSYLIGAQIGLICLTAAWTEEASTPEPQDVRNGLESTVGPAPEGTILNPPNHIATELEVGAFRSSSMPRDTLFPTSLPFADSHEVVNVDEISNATYDLTDTHFKIDFNHIGNSVRTRYYGGQYRTIQDGVSTSTSVRFSVAVDTPYTIRGRYSASGLRGKYFSVKLTNSSSTLPDFDSSQQSQAGATAAQTFVVGGTAGTFNNVLQGNQSGVLLAGERYTFWVFSVLDNQVSAPPATSTGSGSVTMYLGPVVGSYTPFGTGCAGSSGVPALATSGQPQIGSSLVTEVTNVPMDSTAQLLVFGFSDGEWAGLTLPAPLDSLGLWNCTLYISADIGVPMVKDGSSASYSLDIPNDMNLLGLPFFNQALIQDPAAPNPQQWIVSSACRGVVGGM